MRLCGRHSLEDSQVTASTTEVLRWEFLARTSESLLASLDLQETLDHIVNLAIPQLGDWCIIDLVEDPRSGSTRRAAGNVIDDAKRTSLNELVQHYEIGRDNDVGYPRVIRSGVTQVWNGIDETLLRRAASSDRQLELWRALGVHAGVIAPLRSRGEIVGSLTLVFSHSSTYSERDIRFIETFANYAASAITNARLYTDARNANEQRESAIEALKRSERLYKAVTDTVPALISYVDKDHCYQFNSRGFVDALGYKPGELTGKHVTYVLGDDGYKTLLPYVERALAGESVQYEHQVQTKNGTKILAGSYAPDIAPDGTVRGFVAIVQDLTEKRRIERALRDQDEVLRSFYNSVPLHMGVTELRGDDIYYVHVNAATAANRGVPIERMQGGWMSELGVEPDNLTYWLEQYRAAERLGRERGESLRIEHQLSGADQEGWMSVTLAWLGVSETGYSRFSYIGENITERKLAELTIRDSEQRFRMLVAQSPISTQIIHPDGRTLQVNEAWEQLWGMTLDLLTNYNILSDPELVRRNLLPILQRAFQGEQVELPLSAYTPDRGVYEGQERWVRARAYPTKSDTGEICEIVLMHEDMTEQMEAKFALERALERLEIATNVVRGLVYEMDATGEVTRTDGLLDLLGFRPEEAEPTIEWWLDRVHPADVITARSIAFVADRYSAEYRIRHRDGHYVQIWDQGRVERDNEGALSRCIGFTLDVTERRKLEDELREATFAADSARESAEQAREQAILAKEEAEAANSAKDHFLAILSHELRTPLTPSLLHSQLLLEDPELDSFTRDSLSVIHRNIELEARLIDDLLDVTRIARGKLSLEKRPSDLHDIIRHAVLLCEEDARRHRLNIRLDFQASKHSTSVDPARFQQIIWNLLANAVKFTPENGQVSVTTSNPQPELLRIVVQDSGIGIDASYLEKIFDPFDQGAIETRQRAGATGGLGLGLAIVRKLVEMHGGEVRATSEGKGTGSAFTVEIPLV